MQHTKTHYFQIKCKTWINKSDSLSFNEGDNQQEAVKKPWKTFIHVIDELTRNYVEKLN